MTVVTEPLVRGVVSEMSKPEAKTTLYDDFDEIVVDPNISDEFNLNPMQISQMSQFDNVNIGQMMNNIQMTTIKTEPHISSDLSNINLQPLEDLPPSLIGHQLPTLTSSRPHDVNMTPMGHVVTESNDLLANSHYHGVHPYTTTNSSYSSWSQPHASPESLVGPFSNFNCAEQFSAMQAPSPPSYFQSSTTPATAPSPPSYFHSNTAAMAPQHSWGANTSYGYCMTGSNYSSPTHSYSEPVSSAPYEPIALSSVPSQPMSISGPTPSQMSASFMSHSYPGAVQSSHPQRDGQRHASGGGLSHYSSRSSPASHGSPGGHGSWAELSPYPGYTATGVPSVHSEGDSHPFASDGHVTPAGSIGEDFSGLSDSPGIAHRLAARSVGHARGSPGRRARSKSTSHGPKSMELWQFLWVLLTENKGEGAVEWLNEKTGLFRVINQAKLCGLWADVKKRKSGKSVTQYANLTRTMRYYYQRQIMKKGERDHEYMFLLGNIQGWIQTRGRSHTC